MSQKVTITSVRFRNFKAFEHFSLSLSNLNILVGPNNSGKSTILNAFRVLAAGLRRANAKRATLVLGPKGEVYGHVVPTEGLPISLENVHTNYNEDIPTTVTFRLSNKQELELYFPSGGGCLLIPSETHKANSMPSMFKNIFPIKVGFVPVLGPLEHNEVYVHKQTVQRNLATHRASRHFRNFWHYFPDGFEEFAEVVNQTWHGMELSPPELINNYETVVMFCKENRIDRELYWAGFGFQIWCQLLTHIVRNKDVDLLVIDEPDIYLHPDMQRQLLSILRDTDPDILLATHSTEIISEAVPSEIFLVDKTKSSASRLQDTDQVQDALELLGSNQNITLTQLARTRRVLFVEGQDFKILSRFARQLNMIDIANQADFTVVSSGGFSQWEKIKSLRWGFEKTLGKSLVMGAIFDRDYRCSERIEEIKSELRSNLRFSHIHTRKELENYLLVPSVLDRAIRSRLAELKRRGQEIPDEVRSASDILDKITQPMRGEILGQYMSWRSTYFRNIKSSLDEGTINKETIQIFDLKWLDIDSRMEIVPGKKVYKKFNQVLRDDFNFNLTPIMIISQFKRDEIPTELFTLFRQLEKFKRIKPD